MKITNKGYNLLLGYYVKGLDEKGSFVVYFDNEIEMEKYVKENTKHL